MGMKSIGCLHKLFIFLQESCMLCICFNMSLILKPVNYYFINRKVILEVMLYLIITNMKTIGKC